MQFHLCVLCLEPLTVKSLPALGAAMLGSGRLWNGRGEAKGPVMLGSGQVVKSQGSSGHRWCKGELAGPGRGGVERLAALLRGPQYMGSTWGRRATATTREPGARGGHYRMPVVVPTPGECSQ